MEEISAKVFIPVWEEIAKNEKLTDTGLCKRLGVHPGTVARWRDGKTETVRLRLVRTIEAKLGYKLEVGNDGALTLVRPEKGWQPRGESHGARSHDIAWGPRRELLSLPLAANLRAVEGKVVFKKSGSFVPLPESELRDCFYLRVNDDSMKPALFEGDILLVARKTRRLTDGLAVIVSADSTRIRRVVLEAKRVRLLADNLPKISEIFDPKEEIICPIMCTFYSSSETGQPQVQA